MTEVEKLYELAGVEKEFDYLECHRGRSSICCPLMDYENEKDEKCEGCVNSSKMQEVYSYPEFTAEKQIELIKWLGSKYGLYIVDKYSIGALVGEYVEEFCTKKNFEDALAGCTNSIWQDLTTDEQEQIREILK